ncbi:hypothetical protein [Rhabdochromatium marinum]|uniref:hypothetical protein n=1 Tax=Rhabdochromatium marinum TaxID=48729 RepID=UPI001903D46E|nr:hypothetical protein [Rhabdochromatium marinum]MBK1649978.1 hypothetical protein [Rhabdochromatium marinum]
MSSSTESSYLHAFYGGFSSTLRWPQFDALWAVLRDSADQGWYLYAIGEAPPTEPADAESVRRFLEAMDELLKREHNEDFCGIVYADSLTEPRFVKIYDPNNLGVVCGYSEHPPLPGWTLSQLAPVDLPQATAPVQGRRRWWRQLFKRS